MNKTEFMRGIRKVNLTREKYFYKRTINIYSFSKDQSHIGRKLAKENLYTYYLELLQLEGIAIPIKESSRKITKKESDIYESRNNI